MDTITASVIVIAIFAVVVVIAFLLYSRRGNATIKGPFGTSLDVGGTNENENIPSPSTQSKSNQPQYNVYNVINLPDNQSSNPSSSDLPQNISSPDLQVAQFLAEVEIKRKPGDEFDYEDSDQK